MKSQIALIGIGLVIAAGVAYAELKPANNAPNTPVVSTTPAPAAAKAPAEVKTPAPKKSAVPKIATPKVSKPTISGGGGDDDEGGDDD
jgi:hypothetical protein